MDPASLANNARVPRTILLLPTEINLRIFKEVFRGRKLRWAPYRFQPSHCLPVLASDTSFRSK